jgi:hypothetical protein
MDRRKFIKSSAIVTAGSLILPPKLVKGFNKSFSGSKMIEPSSRPKLDRWKDDEINVAWIGHATVLINFFGKYILTDPVFFEAVGVYIEGYILGPRRASLPALMLEDIPKPDFFHGLERGDQHDVQRQQEEQRCRDQEGVQADARRGKGAAAHGRAFRLRE